MRVVDVVVVGGSADDFGRGGGGGGGNRRRRLRLERKGEKPIREDILFLLPVIRSRRRGRKRGDGDRHRARRASNVAVQERRNVVLGRTVTATKISHQGFCARVGYARDGNTGFCLREGGRARPYVRTLNVFARTYNSNNIIVRDRRRIHLPPGREMRVRYRRTA